MVVHGVCAGDHPGPAERTVHSDGEAFQGRQNHGPEYHSIVRAHGIGTSGFDMGDEQCHG